MIPIRYGACRLFDLLPPISAHTRKDGIARISVISTAQETRTNSSCVSAAAKDIRCGGNPFLMLIL